MKVSELTTKLQAALMDSAELMEGNEPQLIETALADYSRYRPQTKLATFSLMNNQLMYAAPEDLIRVRTLLYGQNQRAKQPWQNGYPRKLPRLVLTEDEQDKKWLRLTFFPADTVIASCGRDVSYTYYGRRTIKNEVISIDTQDEPLLLLRCIAEAVKYIMVHQLNKTVSVRNSIGGEAKNGTPAAVHEQLMAQFERQIKDA